jgi:hypothetical protein
MQISQNMLTTAILSSVLTVTSGLILFILSNLFLKLVLEPIVEVKKVIGKISNHLILYANRFSNVADIKQVMNNEELRKDILETQNTLRSLASELVGTVQIVPCYSFCARIGLLPKLDNIKRAASCLIGLSNTLTGNEKTSHILIEANFNRIDEIKRLLKIKGSI